MGRRLVVATGARVLVSALALAFGPGLSACERGGVERGRLERGGVEIPSRSVGEAGPNVHAAPRAWFRVTGAPLEALRGERQQAVASGDGALVLQVLRDVDAGSERYEGSREPLAPGSGFDSVGALGVAPGAASVRELADRVGRSVRARVRQQRVYGDRSPSQTWRSRRGDCTEIADVTAAILRDHGVEARVVGGVAPYDGELRWHAWVEYRDGRWAALDPTFGEHPPGPGHIRMDTGRRSADLARLEALIGRVAIEPASAQAFREAARAGAP